MLPATAIPIWIRRNCLKMSLSATPSIRKQTDSLKITGTVDKPSITVDYGRLTGGINSRKEKQKILEDTLLEQWQWLKPKEP